MKLRKAGLSRKTKETEIDLRLNLDGSGSAQLNTGIPFFDHMLELFTVHGLFDLALTVKGDLEVDFHHTVEDIGICLGQAFREALGQGQKIRRFSSGLVPMDEALCQIAMDISNRPYLDLNATFPKSKIGKFDTELIEEFLRAFVNNSRITLHIHLLSGKNLHHQSEAIFKALGIHLDLATQRDPRKTGVPSSKGVL